MHPVDPFCTAVKSPFEFVVMVILASMHASSSAVGSNITVSPILTAVIDIGIVVSGGSCHLLNLLLYRLEF